MSESSSSSSSDDETFSEPLSFISGITVMTSYDTDYEFKDEIEESPRSSRILKEVMTRMHAKMQLLSETMMESEKASKDGGIDEFDWDSYYDDDWTAKSADSPSDLLTTLKQICWNMTNNTKICLANNQKLVSKGSFGFDMPRLQRIIMQLSLIEEDLDEFALSAVPVVRKLSAIRKLMHLITHLTGRYGETVSTKQVKEQINSQRLMSLYEGFLSYRQEDLKSLETYRFQLHRNVGSWTMTFPYIRSFCEQTEYLSQTGDRWDDVDIPISELSECYKNMRYIAARADKFLYLIKALLRHADGSLKGYKHYRRTLQTNLNNFLTVDIFNLFLKEAQN